MLIIDEATRIEDQLWAALSPMARGTARVLMLSTPAGARGVFYEQWRSTESWHRVRVTATESKLWSPRDLERQRSLLGDFDFRQEFGLEFLADDNQLFLDADIEAAFVNTIKAVQLEGLA
jgi:hypothetical protein